MTWTRLDDNISDHPKMLAVSPLAELLYLRALVYSNKHGTDGLVLPSALTGLTHGFGSVALHVVDGPYFEEWRKPTPDDLAAELVAVNLWRRRRGRFGGWMIHDFGDYQPSAARREAVHKARVAAGKAGGKVSGARRRVEANTDLLRYQAPNRSSVDESIRIHKEAKPEQVLEAKRSPVPSRPVREGTTTTRARSRAGTTAG